MRYLLVFLLLTGCATKTNTVVQKVDIPIPVECKVETPVEPEFCYFAIKPEQDLYDKVRCLLSDMQLRIAYEIELKAALKSCK